MLVVPARKQLIPLPNYFSFSSRVPFAADIMPGPHGERRRAIALAKRLEAARARGHNFHDSSLLSLAADVQRKRRGPPEASVSQTKMTVVTGIGHCPDMNDRGKTIKAKGKVHGTWCPYN